MASGPRGGEAGEKKRRTESKVYTRKTLKGPKSKVNNSTNSASLVNSVTTTLNTNNANSSSKDNNNNSIDQIQAPPQILASEEGNSSRQRLVSRLDVASDDCSSLSRQQGVMTTERNAPLWNGEVTQGPGGPIKINLAFRTKKDLRELRRKLASQLDMIRSLVKKIEGNEWQSGDTNDLNALASEGFSNESGARRPQTELMPLGANHELRPLKKLSVSVVENSHGVSDLVDKEKRTPKANQVYLNSEFLLAKDKFPPAENNKKSKSIGKKQGAGGDMGSMFETGSKFFKSCSSLLDRLMKHKHGWVFNQSVDVEGLGLHDYYTIIRNPMDLGTVKSRLHNNGYKSPKGFAEDVRLTFNNAMTYNPKGQDVHVMAEQLSKIFEDRWAIIESDYNREMRFAVDQVATVAISTPRLAPPVQPPPLDMRRVLDRSESMTQPANPKQRPINITPSGRTPSLKKPKAKDPYKRDMTYEEKQKLSASLQNLPSEKLGNIVQIIKKRNSKVLQLDDEIEVDIDSVDTETLWELDRFVTNYKKSMSKSKRKAELAIQARAKAENNAQEKNSAAVVAENPKITKRDKSSIPSPEPPEREKRVDRSRSSGSSSSSGDSRSSSSDSDSDSSSAAGSDAGHSPRH